MSDASGFERELGWTREHMPLTAAAVEALPDLGGVRLACSMHLEVKMVPALEGFLRRGARLFLATCNPHTVCDRTMGHVLAAGAEGHAFRGMSDAELARSWRMARDFAPTHLCEMGADLTSFFLTPEGEPGRAAVKAGLEATGSGQNRLAGLQVPYPIFNWDDVPIKEGIHNRRMVGLVACQVFFERTRLTFHNKRVLVVGYGPVGRSVCDAARAYGGRILVTEVDPARALEARFGGEEVVALEEGLAAADVVITATGARGVVGARHLPLLKDGAFLLNVGHASEEYDVPALLAHPHEEVRPHVTCIRLDARRVYLFASGAMANLTAGQGDSLNAFDVALAVMVAGVGFLVREGAAYPPGVHLLPERAWMDVARAALLR